MKKLLGACLGLLLTQAPAYALVNHADVVAGCGGGQNCVQLVADYIADLKSAGQSDEAVDQMLADLVVDLAAAAQGKPGAVRNGIAAGIQTASAAFEDPEKARQSGLVANTVLRESNTMISAVSASGT